MDITEHNFTGPPRNGGSGHTTYYLEAGPTDGTLLLLVHGWPERALSWRKMMPTLAGLGFRVVAPDMRGYGNSTVYTDRELYTHMEIAKDLNELLDHLGVQKAVIIGHDHGSPAVGNFVSHYPERVYGAGFLCVPYLPDGFELSALVPLVDRRIYPEKEFPLGQWDYHRYHYEHFDKSVAYMNGDPGKVVKMMFRAAGPQVIGKPAGFARVNKDGGWFGGRPLEKFPDFPFDPAVLTEQDCKELTDGLKKNGFMGPNAYYWCLKKDAEWSRQAANGGRLDFPVLFIHARFDQVCATLDGAKLPEPMRQTCPDLTEFIVDAGHWVMLEKPSECCSAIAQWLAVKFPQLWNRKGIARL